MKSMSNFISTRINPFSKVYPILIKKSLETETDDVRVLTPKKPSYKVEHWEIFGDMPVWSPSDALTKMKIAAVTYIYRMCAGLPWNKSRFMSAEDVKNFILKSYLKELAAPLIPQEFEKLDQNFYEQIIVNGHYDLKPYEEGAHALDLNFMGELPMKDGYGKYGGIAVVSFKNRCVLYIVNICGEKIYPTDERWEFEKFKFRSSLFVFMNTGPHGVMIHGVICPKFYLATHQLSEKHPLKVLLAPFVEGIEKNILRAKATIFSETGGLKLITGFSNEGIDLGVNIFVKNFKIKFVNELHLPEEMQQILQSFWDPIFEFVSAFVNYYKIGEIDPEVAHFKSYLAKNIQSKFGELSLAESISFCIFFSTVSHYLWGHTFNGGFDRSFISSTFTEGISDLTNNDLFEEINSTVTRTGIIISVNRKVIRMMGDFSHLTDDHSVKKIFRTFSEKLRALKGRSGPIDMDKLASSGMM